MIELFFVIMAATAKNAADDGSPGTLIFLGLINESPYFSVTDEFDQF